MAAAKEHHTLLWIAGAGGAVVAGYELFYKPWQTAQALAAATGLTPLLPTGGLSSPSYVGPSPVSGQQLGSIPDPRVNPGGDVGAAMWKKNWTQGQAAARLTAIKTGIANSRQAIATLSSNTANPAAAGINAAQAQLAVESAALANATATYNRLVASGDVAGAAAYSAEIAGHKNDINELQARIDAASKPADNTAAIAAYQGTLAGLLADYTSLTNMTYGG